MSGERCHGLGPAASRALTALLSKPALLAFDFDGTLAPIVAVPGAAKPLQAIVRALTSLQHHHHIAIITGRSVADVRPLLGFAPDAIVGSHGAEDPSHAGSDRWVRDLDGLRAVLLGPLGAAARRAGVVVEDKGASVALHHRLARDGVQAEMALSQIRELFIGQLHVFPGKRVLNFTSKGAPDKGDAVEGLQQRFGLSGVLFVGDDDNDEPVFERQKPDWVTIKIGDPLDKTAARFRLDHPRDLSVLLNASLRWNTAPRRSSLTKD